MPTPDKPASAPATQNHEAADGEEARRQQRAARLATAVALVGRRQLSVPWGYQRYSTATHPASLDRRRRTVLITFTARTGPRLGSTIVRIRGGSED